MPGKEIGVIVCPRFLVSKSESPSPSFPPDPISLIRDRYRPILAGAIGVGGLAFVVGLLRSPEYEATAFLEVAEPAEVSTVEGRLRFASLYESVTEGDSEAARSLVRRTRVRNQPRGSRLIAVSVTHSEPGIAAAEANSLVETYVDLPAAALRSEGEDLQQSLRLAQAYAGEPPAADSLRTLIAAWGTTTREFATLLERYDEEAEHPAVIGARERRDDLAARIQAKLQAEPYRDVFDSERLPEGAGDLEALASVIDTIAEELNDIQLNLPLYRERAAELQTAAAKQDLDRKDPPVLVAEPAATPAEASGPGTLAFAFVGSVVGAFLGFLLALCGCCCGDRPRSTHRAGTKGKSSSSADLLSPE